MTWKGGIAIAGAAGLGYFLYRFYSTQVNLLNQYEVHLQSVSITSLTTEVVTMDVVLLVLTYTKHVYASQQTINLFFTLFQEMARWCIYIIMIGSGLVTASQLFGVMDTRAKAGVIRAAAGMPDNAVTQHVDQQNVNVQNGENTEIKSSVTHDSGKLDAENKGEQKPSPATDTVMDDIDQSDPDHPANIAARQQAANDNKQTKNAVQPKE